MNKQKLIVRLFSSYFVLVLLAMTLIIMFASNAMEDFYFNQSVNNLKARAILIDKILTNNDTISPQSLQTFCQNLGKETGSRITLITPKGKVLADSHEDPAKMDLHNDRPEIIEAIQGKDGISQRSSYTLEEEHLYYARMSSNNDRKMVIRVSFPTLELKSALRVLRDNLLLGGLIITLLLGAVNWYLSRQILKPIQIMEAGALRFARGKLKMKIPESNIKELGNLAQSLNLMADQIFDRIRVITQQKNEQVAILSSMTEGVLALGPKGELLSCNRAAAAMFGLQPNSILGRPLHEVIRHTALIDFANEVLTDRKNSKIQLSLFSPEERTLNVIGSRMPAKKGAVGGAVLVFTDLTQIQKLESVRREFVANVSHELKTPITSIQGYVETLQEGAIQDTENASRFLEIISKHASRLGQIVDDLLELSRIEEMSEGNHKHLTLQSLNKLIETSLDQYRSLAQSKSILIETELVDHLQLGLNAKLFSHALSNLLDNAIKYSKSNTTIHVSSRLEQDKIVLEIRDQGHGIEAQHLSRIFERFYRVDKGRSRDVGGTGLGLSIVKHIIRIHHASIEVESEIGVGTTFRIIFTK